MKLSSTINDFLKYLQSERQVQPKTLENYQHYLKKFLEFTGDISISSLDLELVRKYRLYLAREPLKKITQNYFMIALRAFLRYLKEQGIEVLEANEVKLGVAERNSHQSLDEDLVKRLLHAPDTSDKVGLRDKAILETLSSAGLKVSELSSLDRECLGLGQKKLVVVKRDGSRDVYISDSACYSLDQYLKSRKDAFKPLFIRFQGKAVAKDEGEKMRLTPRSIQRIVEKYVKKTGLPIKATPSILRHSFARENLEKGEDLSSLQYSLGHKHLSSTQVYNEVLRDK